LFNAEGSEINPELVGRFSRFGERLGANDSSDPKIDSLKFPPCDDVLAHDHLNTVRVSWAMSGANGFKRYI
jgi:hypothetical protein